MHRPILPEGASSLELVNKVCYLLHVAAACEDGLPGACGHFVPLGAVGRSSVLTEKAVSALFLQKYSNRTRLRFPKAEMGTLPHPTQCQVHMARARRREPVLGDWSPAGGPTGSPDLLLCPALLKRSFVK